MRSALAIGLVLLLIPAIPSALGPFHGAPAPAVSSPAPLFVPNHLFGTASGSCDRSSALPARPDGLINVPAAGTGGSGTYDITQLANNTAVNATVTAPSGVSLNTKQYVLLGIGEPVDRKNFTAAGVAEANPLGIATIAAPVAYLPNGTLIDNINNLVSEGSTHVFEINHAQGWWWTYTYDGSPITGATTTGTPIPWENGTYDLGTAQASGLLCEAGYRVGPSFVAIAYAMTGYSAPSIPRTNVPWALGVEPLGSSSTSYVPPGVNAMPQFNASIGVIGIEGHNQVPSLGIDRLTVGSSVPYPGSFAALWGNYKVIALNQSTVTPVSAGLAYGATQAFNATAIDENGNWIPNARFTWQYSPAALGALNRTTGSTVALTAPTTSISGILWANVTYNCSTKHDWANVTVTPTGGPAIDHYVAVPSNLLLGATTTLVVFANWSRPITYHYTGLPPGCTSTSTSNLACTPSGTGSFSVRVYLNDTVGKSSTSTTPLNVYAVPTIKGFKASPSSLTVNTSTTIAVTASGGIPPFIYDYHGLPPGCPTGHAAATFSCSPTTTGTYAATVFYNDSAGDSTNATTTLTVNVGLKITGFTISPPSIPFGGTTFLNVSATGGTPPYSYLYGRLPLGCTSSSTTNLVCTPTVSGTFVVLVNVTDASGALATGGQSFTVAPSPVPVIASFLASPNPVNVSQATTFRTVATGGSGALTYSYAGLPVGCTSSSTANLACIPTLGGSFPVTVTVKDTASHQATATTTLTVNTVGSPVVISSFTATPPSFNLGGTTTLAVTATGGSGTLSYAYFSLPKGCVSASTPSLSCTPTGSGTFSITVFVNDTGGHSSHASATVTVNPSSNGQGGLALFGSWLPLILLAIVAAVVAVIAVLVLRKRKKAAPPTTPPAAWQPAPEGQVPPGPPGYPAQPPTDYPSTYEPAPPPSPPMS